MGRGCSRRCTRAAALALGLAAFAARGARAEPPSAEAGAEAEAGADAVAAPDVEAWFEQANQKFAAHDYAAALALLERACAHSDFPGCALNLGAVHHALRHCVEAKHHYERYLRDEPAGERAEEARAALDELDAHCPGERSPSALAPSSASAASPALPPAGTLLPLTSRLAAREYPVFDAPGSAASAAAPGSDAPAHSLAADDAAALSAALERSALGNPGSSASTTLDAGTRYRAIAASVTALGGAAGLTTVYLGLKLSKANAEFEEHKAAPYDAAQAARLERAREYRALTIGSGAATALLLGVGGVFWWLGVDDDTDLGVALDAGPELRLGGRF